MSMEKNNDAHALMHTYHASSSIFLSDETFTCQSESLISLAYHKLHRETELSITKTELASTVEKYNAPADGPVEQYVYGGDRTRTHGTAATREQRYY